MSKLPNNIMISSCELIKIPNGSYNKNYLKETKRLGIATKHEEIGLGKNKKQCWKLELLDVYM